jgi:hypothetical protein
MDQLIDDIWYSIFEIIIYGPNAAGSDYKSLILVNHKIQKIGYQLWDDAKCLLANHLLTLLKLYPNKPWSWSSVRNNPNITLKIIESNPDLPWSGKYKKQKKSSRKGFVISSINPNLTWEMVVTQKNIVWNWAVLSENLFRKSPDYRNIKNKNRLFSDEFYRI